MNASKQELFDEIKKCIAMDAERWITIHPFGKGGKGNNNNNNAGGKAPYVRVLIDDDGVIKAGMGGTHNGEKISQLGKNKDTNEKKEDSTISSYKNRDMSHVKYFDGILSELSRIKKDYLEYIDGLSEWKKRDLHNPDEFHGIPEVDEQYAVIKEALEKAKDFKIDDKDVFKDTDKLIPPDGASDEELERFNVPSNFAWGKDMTDWSDAWHRARLYLNDFDDLSKEEISTVLNAAQRVRDSQKYWENIDTLISDAIDKKREGKKVFGIGC